MKRTQVDRCTFAHEGQRCVFGRIHTIRYHHLGDGRSAPYGPQWAWDGEAWVYAAEEGMTASTVLKALSQIPPYAEVKPGPTRGIRYFPAQNEVEI